MGLTERVQADFLLRSGEANYLAIQMVLFRIGTGATPQPPQPNPIYYSPPTTTTTSSSSSTGGTTPTTKPTTTPPTTTPPPQPSTGLSTAIESLTAALSSPPPVTVTPPQVPLIPALGPNFVGWRPWELINQWGTGAELQWLINNLLNQAEIRQQILEQMAREGLPVTPVPVVTEEETKRPLGLRVHFIPM